MIRMTQAATERAPIIAARIPELEKPSTSGPSHGVAANVNGVPFDESVPMLSVEGAWGEWLPSRFSVSWRAPASGLWVADLHEFPGELAWAMNSSTAAGAPAFSRSLWHGREHSTCGWA